MNLIEKLGGYESAKSIRDMNVEEFDGDASGVTTHYMGNSFLQEDLELALLEHRSQHNIFEVGDKVVSKYENLNLFGDVVLEIEYFRKLSSVVLAHFTNENDYRVDALRHATDEEIKAGHRL